MTRAARARTACLAVVAAVAFAGCATVRVNSYLSRQADFGRYRSYAWAASDRLATGDPRLDNNPFFLARLRMDVDRHLAARGFEPAASPDLVIHYHASVGDEIDVNGADSAYGQCDVDECSPVVYQAGTIVLDLVDARTNQLVWRGWARDTLDGAIDNQDWLEQKIDRAVLKIMERLPKSPLGASRG